MDLLVFFTDGKLYYPIIRIKKLYEPTTELHENIDKFIESGVKYFGDEFADLEHIGSMYTIRAVLKDRDYDDARPTLVKHEEDNVYSLFSGKIDTCVNAGRELIKVINVPSRNMHDISARFSMIRIMNRLIYGILSRQR